MSYVDHTAGEIFSSPWYSKTYKGRYRVAR